MLELLIAATVFTAVDAERAFADDAQEIGQWTAFRKWADDSAVMFVPQAVWVQDFLKDEKDPPKALTWGPSDSWVSCDGRTAVNRGPWSMPDGKAHGYFTTVWMRSGDTWRWVYDGGDTLEQPLALPAEPRVEQASCEDRAQVPDAYRDAVTPTARIAGQPPADAGQGRSADGTLLYEWAVSKDGARRFVAKLWDGEAYRTVVDQSAAAPPPQ